MKFFPKVFSQSYRGWKSWETRRLEKLEQRVAVLYGWVGGDKLREMDKAIDITNEFAKKGLKKFEEIELIRESNLGLVDLRIKVDLLIKYLGLEQSLKELAHQEKLVDGEEIPVDVI